MKLTGKNLVLNLVQIMYGRKVMKRIIPLVIAGMLAGCNATGAPKSQKVVSNTPNNASDLVLDPRIQQFPRTISEFKKGNQQCYDRDTRPYTFVVDAHNHFRPFGGNAIPLFELDNYFHRLGVLFVNVYGIGQTLPIGGKCEYYLDCPGEKVTPSMHNDFRNASNYLEYTPEGLHLTLSMSFPDLAKPKLVLPRIKLINEDEYPNQFIWMGEVNLVKQALFNNGHVPTPIEAIPEWAGFMKKLRDGVSVGKGRGRGEGTEKKPIPIAIHSDLGNNDEQTKYLHLMEKVLELYPDNKIVWVHMGLSKELTNIDPQKHIGILQPLLDKYPNLMLDLSWRVLYDEYFSKHEIREQYVEFINKNPTRFLPGTDFVASRKKSFGIYAEEVEVNSRINLYMDDDAFRHIALGENYFRFLELDDYEAPQICQ